MSVLNRLVLIAVFALGTVLVSGEGSAFAQRHAYERAQYEVDVPPPVEPPTASTEADLFPSLGDGARSVQDQDYDASAVDPQYVDSGYSDGDVIEPTPLEVGEAYGEPYFTDTGVDSYETIGPASDSPAPIYSTGTWWGRGRWYTQMDVMVMNLDDDFRNLVIQAANSRLSFEQLAALHYQPGTKLTLGRFLGRDAASRDHMVEFSFMGLFSWDSGREVISRNELGMGDISIDFSFVGAGIAPDDFIQPFIAADRMGFFYDSDYNDFQLNYKLQTRPGRDVMALQPNGMWVRHAVSSQIRSVMAGLRVSSIDEQTSLTSQLQQTISQTEFVDGFDGSTSETTNVVTDDDAQRGRYLVRMNNDLFGAHLGGEITEKYDEWSWGIRGKVGGLVNLVNRRSLINSRTRVRRETSVDEVQRVNDDDELLYIATAPDGTETITTNPVGNEPLIDTTTTVVFDAVDQVQGENITDETFSLLLEAGLFGKYQLRPNLMVRVGYDVMLYSSVGFAAENIGFENRFPELNVNKTALFHGGYAGFETTW